MTVYVLYNIYYDGCNLWETIIDLYANEDHAIMAQIELEQSNSDNGQSYKVYPIIIK
jgi:hypothetical protein